MEILIDPVMLEWLRDLMYKSATILSELHCPRVEDGPGEYDETEQVLENLRRARAMIQDLLTHME